MAMRLDDEVFGARPSNRPVGLYSRPYAARQAGKAVSAGGHDPAREQAERFIGKEAPRKTLRGSNTLTFRTNLQWRHFGLAGFSDRCNSQAWSQTYSLPSLRMFR